MALSAPPSEAEAEQGTRNMGRRPVTFSAHLRERAGKPIAVDVIDLSRQGFQIAHHRAFHVSTQVWLKLPGLESLLATVKWSDGTKIGCQFEAPLHEAVLEKFVANSAR